MFKRLQKRWNVNGLRVLLILCTFAIGGSLTGYAGKKIMNWMDIDQKWLWIIIYIIIITILWPITVLIISVVFGQFNFFRIYLRKMARRMGFGKTTIKTPEPEIQRSNN